MAENSSELDAINHLLEIERDAAVLIDDAKIEADKRIANAKNQYNTQYKSKYDEIVNDLDSKYNTSVDDISNKYKQEIDAYKTQLESKEQNEKAFSSLLDKLLFE